MHNVLHEVYKQGEYVVFGFVVVHISIMNDETQKLHCSTIFRMKHTGVACLRHLGVIILVLYGEVLIG